MDTEAEPMPLSAGDFAREVALGVIEAPS